MKVSSCSSSVAPPNTTMMASESQCTVETLPFFQWNQAICAIDATMATAVAA